MTTNRELQQIADIIEAKRRETAAVLDRITESLHAQLDEKRDANARSGAVEYTERTDIRNVIHKFTLRPHELDLLAELEAAYIAGYNDCANRNGST